MSLKMWSSGAKMRDFRRRIEGFRPLTFVPSALRISLDPALQKSDPDNRESSVQPVGQTELFPFPAQAGMLSLLEKPSTTPGRRPRCPVPGALCPVSG
jgi:hypothetical protein